MGKKTTKCIIMSRVSTTMQELDVQEEECISMAIADGYSKDNMILVPRVGESARKIGEIITVDTPRGPLEIELDRDGIWDMKKHIENDPEIDTVYIWEVSRLARRMDVLTPLLKYFADKKVQLKIKTNGIEYLNPDKSVNPASKMTIEILGEVAEQEMDVKIKRFKRTKKAYAEQGRYSGGKIPYGYYIDRTNGNFYAIKEDEAAIVREIFNLYEAGITQPKIAREFYRRGLVELNLSKVNNILTNNQYTGRPVKQGWSSYERTYPIIITPEQFDHCREIASTNNTFASKAREIYYAHKLIHCKCGRLWAAATSKVCYRCAEAYRTGNTFELHTLQCDNKTSIGINVIDSLLWHIAIDAEVHYLMNLAAEDKQKYEEQIALAKQKLAFTETRLQEQDNKKARASESYIDGIISKEKRNEKFKEIDAATKAILLEQTEYTTEIEHLNTLITEADRMFNYSDVSEIASEIEKAIALKDKISTITDDSERYDIIHRHIKKITIENRKVEFDFKYRGTKQTPARFISILLFTGEELHYTYISFSGGKNVWIKSNEHGDLLEKIEIEYIERFIDNGKRQRRAQEKAERQQKYASQYPEEKYVFSFTGLMSFLGVKRKVAYKLGYHGCLDDAKVYIHKTKVAFDKEKVLAILKEKSISDEWIKNIYNSINC